jgi:hypothetical protein
MFIWRLLWPDFVYVCDSGGLLTRWCSIVLVHGLNGDPHDSWTSKKTKCFWPFDLLPADLEDQRVRVLTYGYDADVATFTDGAGKSKLHVHAENLVARLAANRNVSTKGHYLS